ncbi:MAG: DUF1273 family protein [Clostridia bacterium]|nr:DUF1273 family protein [Clostridia bacterium]
MNREKTAFFTGHRALPQDNMAELRAQLYSAVGRLIHMGYDSFICGGAIGFDTEAALCVLAYREKFPNVRLILALPCRDQTQKWENLKSLNTYKHILGAADLVEYMQPFYTSDCMHIRNRWMADHSSVCLAYLTSQQGGTAYTFRYAQKKGLKAVNLAEGLVSEQLKIPNI